MKLLYEKMGAEHVQLGFFDDDMLILYDEVRDEFLRKVDKAYLKEKNDPEIKEHLGTIIDQIVKLKIGKVPKASFKDVSKGIRDDILGYGPITDLVEDPDIEEIMVNKYNSIFYEQDGKIHPINLTFRNERHLMRVIHRIVDDIGRRIDESSPRVDARLPDGSRINAIIPPIAPDGACLTVRKFKKTLGEDELIGYGTFPRKYLSFLQRCVRARLNIMVTGGSGTGKTSFLNFLSSYIDDSERIVTIEDDLELNIKKPNVVRLESRNINTEGKGLVTIRDLVVNSLRMRPDRIIVGEVRGGEALDMLQAVNTGHDGSMTTGHANSPEDMLTRLESMVLMAESLDYTAIRKQIASGINIIIHLTKYPEDGSRKISRIIEVTGYSEGKINTRDVIAFERSFENKGLVTGEFKMFADECSPLMKRLQYWGGR